MKTICIRIPGTTDRPDCKKLNEESITVSSVAGKPCGFFTITVKGSITVSLQSGEKLLLMRKGADYPTTWSGKEGAGLNKYTLSSAGTYAFLIVKSVFRDALVFSDITQVTRFDASTAAPNLNSVAGCESGRGLEVPVHELMKFSLMQEIGLRYSLTGINKKTVLDLRAFRNVTKLYLGTANTVTNYLEDVILENETMQKLIDMNLATNRIPYNFNELTICRSIIFHSSPSWQNIRHLYPGVNITWKQRLCLYFVGITSGSSDDFPYILDFLHVTASIAGETGVVRRVQAPDFTIAPRFMNDENVQKLKNICENVAEFTVGGHKVAVVDNKVVINGTSY